MVRSDADQVRDVLLAVAAEALGNPDRLRFALNLRGVAEAMTEAEALLLRRLLRC